MSTLSAWIALLGWAPLVVVLFAMLPVRRAVVGGAIGAWLLIPPIVIDIPGFPDYGKSSAATVGILIATAIFESQRLLGFRVRWFDLPMILFCACPFFSSLSNDLGPYDGLSASFRQSVAWLFPYLIGRLYLTDLAAMREMAMGMVIGGLLLLPLVLYEIRMSPVLMSMVYGVGNWEGAYRFGGYRPRVFFAAGLELGLWMSAVTLIAWWMWRSRAMKQIAGVPGGVIVATLFVVTILCRSTGSTVLLFIGIGTLWCCWRFQSKRPMWALLSAAPLYCTLRITHLWSGDQLVVLSRMLINESRARSLEYRLINDELLIAKTFQCPLFGWGGFGRAFVYDDYGRILSVPDGMWIGCLSSFGILGLALMTTAMLLPAWLFIKRFPLAQWRHPSIAPAVGIATIVSLMQIDGLFNGMLNLLYVIGAGGLANLGASPGNSSLGSDSRPEQEASDLERPSTNPPRGEVSTLSARYRTLGRSLHSEGRVPEAKTAWEHALALMTPCSASWCDQANNLAWLLANTPVESQRDPARAVELAQAAVQAHPDSATFWNTLGAALHRHGDHDSAIIALERAVDLSEAGTPYDFLFLAMAHAHKGDLARASLAYNQAKFLLERDPASHPRMALLQEEAQSRLKSLESRVPAP